MRNSTGYISATACRLARILADLGPTVDARRALSTIGDDPGRTLRSRADEWSWDASRATWVVDRLVRRASGKARSFHRESRRPAL